MYNADFECRYHRDDVFLETDNISDEEKAYVRDLLYKEDVLNIFSVDFNDDFDVFEQVMGDVYEKIKNCVPLKGYMKKLATALLSEDEQMGLVLMYSYDYMHISHKCVSEYLTTGSISENNLLLMNEICK